MKNNKRYTDIPSNRIHRWLQDCSMSIKLMSAIVIMVSILNAVQASQIVLLDALEDHSGECYRQYLSKIPLEQRTIITSKKCLNEEKRENLNTIFSQIIEVNEYHLSAAVEDETIELHNKRPIKSIITEAAEEFDIVRAASLREYFGLEGQTFESAQVFRNKVLMKDLVRRSNFTVPAYEPTNSGLDLIKFIEKNNFPVVVKPRTGVASIKISILENKEDLRKFLQTNYNCHYFSNLMVEAFVKGEVYKVDGLYDSGVVYSWPQKCINSCLAMALERKVLGSYLLSSANPLTSKLISYAEKLIGVFPISNQVPFHLEVFVTDSPQEIVFCEIASRIGGHVNNTWINGFGIDLEQAFYDIQLGKEQDQIREKITGPHKIPGWLLFPAKLNMKVAKIGTICPFEYCTKYEIFMNVGDSIDNVLGICSNLAKASIISDTEEDFLLKANNVITWFEENLQYS